MFDARFFAFVALAAFLVVSPGATMAVVTETAIDEGPRGALFTVAGVGTANSTLMLAAAFGLSALFAAVPGGLEVLTVGGAVYLSYLGVRALARAATGSLRTPPDAPERHAPHVSRPAPLALAGRGLLTNFLNPPVVLFYITVPPQFISRGDPFLERFLVLGFTHVLMSVAWLSAFALSIGAFTEHLARPPVRRVMEAATGAILVLCGVRLLLR